MKCELILSHAALSPQAWSWNTILAHAHSIHLQNHNLRAQILVAYMWRCIFINQNGTMTPGQYFSILFLGASCSVLGVSLVQMISWLSTLLKSDNEPFIWIRCVGAETPKTCNLRNTASIMLKYDCDSFLWIFCQSHSEPLQRLREPQVEDSWTRLLASCIQLHTPVFS